MIEVITITIIDALLQCTKAGSVSISRKRNCSKISQYRINLRTGTLSAKPLSTATTVRHPEAIALSADGKNAYVTSENDPKLSQYTINTTTGKITPMKPATVKTASGALGVAVTPDPSAK